MSGNRDLYSTTVSRLALRPIQPLIQLVPGALLPGVNRSGHEADLSTPSSAEINECSYTTTLPYTFMACTGIIYLYVTFTYILNNTLVKSFTPHLWKIPLPSNILHAMYNICDGKIVFIMEMFSVQDARIISNGRKGQFSTFN
jgi:hypothetical protein